MPLEFRGRMDDLSSSSLTPTFTRGMSSPPMRIGPAWLLQAYDLPSTALVAGLRRECHETNP